MIAPSSRSRSREQRQCCWPLIRSFHSGMTSKHPQRSSNLRRSCGACFKSKKGCDLGVKQSSRCAQRGLECVYSNEPWALCKVAAEHNAFAGEHDVVTPPKMLDESPQQLHVRLGSSQPSDDFEVARYTNIDDIASTELSLLRLSTPDVVATLDPATVASLVGKFRTFPSVFLQVGQTPFIHSQLYQTPIPTSIQAARDICTVYRSSNPINEVRILRELHSRVRDLVMRGCEMKTFQDLLAAVQALIISQIVRLFGIEGTAEIPSRTVSQDAEPQQELLQRWTYQLWQRAPSLMSSSLSRWRTWLIGESVRRTILIAHLLRAVYSVVRQDYFVHTLFLEALPFDIHTEMWDARTEEDWEALRPGLRPSLVSYREFVTMWDEGRRTQIRDFEDLLLTTLKGVQEIV